MLGDVLLSTGAITSQQLDRALTEQRITGALLGETLLALNLVTEEALARALAHEAGVPFTDLGGRQPDAAAVALVPEPFARKHLLAPLELNGAVLQIVQANPFDVLALDDLRQLTARPIAPVCANADEVRSLLDRCYGNRTGDADHRTDAARVSTVQEPSEAPPRFRALSELGLSRKDLSVVSNLLERSSGLVVVAGRGGAGTTTTLDAMIAHLASSTRPVEEGVERTTTTVRRVHVASGSGSMSAHQIRAVLRHDPDVVVIGAIGDPQSARMALHAALLSDVLVLGVLDAEDATSAVAILIGMGLEPYLLASGLAGVVAQRLLRLVCPACKARVTYPAEILERLGLTPDPGLSFQRGAGCTHCGGTGYRGRTGVFEILAVDTAIGDLIRARADTRAIAHAAAGAGMKTFVDDALAKAIRQQTTVEEVLRVAGA